MNYALDDPVVEFAKTFWGILLEALPFIAPIGALLRDRDGGEVLVGRDGEPVVRYRLSDYDLRHLRTGIDGAAQIHEALAYLIERCPAVLRLVIATREDPPLPLGRLRAAGELGEIRAGELRFSTDEAAAFLIGTLGLGLSDADVTRLQARTEGWPAGVYLAALSLRGHRSAHSFIDQLTGNNRFIADFLAEAHVVAAALDQPPGRRSSSDDTKVG